MTQSMDWKKAQHDVRRPDAKNMRGTLQEVVRYSLDDERDSYAARQCHHRNIMRRMTTSQPPTVHARQASSIRNRKVAVTLPQISILRGSEDQA